MSPLASRAATQTAGFLILFTLIFVSAGTIHFWQRWLFCASFSFSTVATGVYLMRRDPALLERRMRFGPRAESRPRQKIIVAVIFAIFAALLIVPGLEHRFGWSQVPAAIVVLANLLIIAAFGFFLFVSCENRFAVSTITVEDARNHGFDCAHPRRKSARSRPSCRATTTTAAPSPYRLVPLV